MIFADLHIHSRYSRATSKDLSLENLEKWARVKGLDLLGTGDFTHPKWLDEIKTNLKEKEGLLYSKTNFKFLLSGEISLVFTAGRGRRVHLLLLAPSLNAVDRINSYLDTKGRRDYDGRPIFNISCEDFTKAMKNISEDIEVIPAHVWTPWFGVYGSKSGFDSLKEAFGSQYENIHAIETGLSSDPKMNLRFKELQEKTIVSFSDSHSFWPWRLGREATILESANSYQEVVGALRNNKIIGTIEVNPAYGMYHYDGHRACNFSCSPEESKKLGGLCAICKTPLTIGVDSRVNALANFPENYKHEGMKTVYEMLPLHEILSASFASAMNSKKVWAEYNKLIDSFGTELEILLNTPEDKLARTVDEKTASLIISNRQGRIKVKPGYDGVYGEMISEQKQAKLF